MREGRSDVCLLLRHVAVEGNDEKGIAIVVDEHSDVLEDIVGPKPEEGTEAPLLSRTYPPNSRVYTTLMKGYMNAGRVDDVGCSEQGMRETAKQTVERMKESGVQPDVATYGSLAKGIAVARKPGEALLLWNEVKERCEAGNGKPALKPDEELLDALADVCVRGAFFKKALEIVACMEENGIAPNKTKYKKIYIEMHSRMFTSKHASQARQDRRRERKRAAEAFKFWLGLPNSYYGSEWRIGPLVGADEDNDDNQLE
uniref:Pentatricopeptide repeat-containing protein n=1 Tax=Aegilops tauschii TaxID=37682 RepID=M8AXW8_AEGTA